MYFLPKKRPFRIIFVAIRGLFFDDCMAHRLLLIQMTVPAESAERHDAQEYYSWQKQFFVLLRAKSKRPT